MVVRKKKTATKSAFKYFSILFIFFSSLACAQSITIERYDLIKSSDLKSIMKRGNYIKDSSLDFYEGTWLGDDYSVVFQKVKIENQGVYFDVSKGVMTSKIGEAKFEYSFRMNTLNDTLALISFDKINVDAYVISDDLNQNSILFELLGVNSEKVSVFLENEHKTVGGRTDLESFILPDQIRFTRKK